MVKLTLKYWAKARSSAAALPWVKMCCFLGNSRSIVLKNCGNHLYNGRMGRCCHLFDYFPSPCHCKTAGKEHGCAATCYSFSWWCIVYFQVKVAQGRKKQKLAKERAGLSKLPDLKDAEAVQKFFLEEIQLGEELLAQGEYEKGVDHLTNAIAVCGQPQQLLQVLQQTLPPPVFQMLLTKLPTISQRPGMEHPRGFFQRTSP
uniref:Translocase of outer mitochondrial membrane 20 n=1 Tax=Anas platyrhynchos platyrhynchos TaxID=8840 RepID=A0A493TM86_ANAPP